MTRHLGLRTRVKRAEKRQRHRKPKLAIIAAIHPDEQPGPIVGFECNGKRVDLKPGETLPELQRRALATLPGRMLRTLYADSPRIDEAAPVASKPPKAPIANPWPSAGGVPGIGRVASRAELERAGAIRIPPERIV
jgi:hypothetical protein